MTTKTTLTNADIIEEYESIEEPVLPGCIWDFPLLPVANLLAAMVLLVIFVYAALFV